MHFYYMGGNGQHTNFRLKRSFGRITFDEDKFAYITPNTFDSEGQNTDQRIARRGGRRHMGSGRL